MLSEYVKKNKLVILFLFCSIFALSIYANLSYFFKKNPERLAYFPPFIERVNLNHNKHLGAEYYFIAQAIASGKGFSNPFQVDTGPTAWMPPLYAYFLTLLIKFFQSKLLVACCVVFLKNLVLVLTGLVVYKIAIKTSITIKAKIVLLLYLLFLVNSFRWFFQFTHDAWLLLLFVNVIFLLAVFIRGNCINLRIAVTWGIVGGLSMLASPVVGLVWIVLCVTSMPSNKNFKRLVLSSVLFFLICTPWFIRNYIVFDKLIFVKSNLLHDAYLFNYEAKDGYMRESFIYNCLVWTAKDDPNCLYRRVGEVKFMEIYKDKLFDAIRENPDRYISNIRDRFLSALLIYYPHNKQYEKSSLWKTALHAMPFISILLILFLKGYTTSHYIKIAMLMYVLYLLPYIIISYYIRYTIPLTPLKILFSFWGLDLLITRFYVFFKGKLRSDF